MPLLPFKVKRTRRFNLANIANLKTFLHLDSFKEGGLGFNSPEVFKNNLPNSSSGVATSFSQGSSDSGASQSFGGSKPGAAQAFVESASAGSFGDSSNGAIESSFQTMAEVPQRDSAFKTEHLTGGQ